MKFKWQGTGNVGALASPALYPMGANTLLGVGIDNPGGAAGIFGRLDVPWIHTWAAFYNNYVVFGSKITATFTNTTANKDLIINIFPSTNDAPTHGTDDPPPYVGQPYSRYKKLSLIGGGKDTITITHEMDTAKVFGLKDKLSGTQNTNYQGALNPLTGPAQAWYWNLAYADSANSAVTISAGTIIEITYRCMLYNRRQSSSN